MRRDRAVAFRAEVRALRALRESSEFLADYGFRRRRPDLWLEGVQGLLVAVVWASEMLMFGRNPPTMPETPGEWLLVVKEALRGYHSLSRQIRRGPNRVSALTLKRWRARLARLETRLILQTRVMREEFLRRWPRSWDETKERKFGSWADRRLR